jgi:hypothetical protein
MSWSSRSSFALQGFRFTLSNGRQLLARLARGDFNMPDYDGYSVIEQVNSRQRCTICWNLSLSEPEALTSRLLYRRIPSQNVAHRLPPPTEILGRSLMVFERAIEKTTSGRISARNRR